MSSDASSGAATTHEADFEAIAENFVVRSATAYLCGGELRQLVEPPAALPEADPASPTQEPAVLRALESEIYGRFYVRPEPPPRVPNDLASHRDFINALSAANCGIGTWEPGWRIVRQEADGRLVVWRDGVCFWVPAERVRRSGGQKEADFCRVFVPKELRYLLPGFYYAVGNEPPGEDRDSGAPLVRLYWNLRADAALRYMSQMTSSLNSLKVPFRTKVLSDASTYGRADSGVLYLERSDLERAWPAICAIRETLRTGLGPAIPMFSKPLAEGIGLADDPGDGRSFGQVRCAILAKGLWTAFRADAAESADRAEILRAAFREHGLDPDRPHLNPSSPDYDIAFGARKSRAAARAAR